ncbi:MAG: acetate/propionate family kinase, partial [Caldimonas sp.]
MPHRILALNAGSSSLKFALFDAAPALRRTVSGEVGRIGLASPVLEVTGPTPADNFERAAVAPDHAAAAQLLLDWLDPRFGLATLTAVGHRVVRGAPLYAGPARIDAAMLAQLRQFAPLDVEHMQQSIELVEAVQARCPALPQVACFDTTFHLGLPRVATLLPIPRRYEAQGVRRYGFHGLSYQFLMRELARLDGAAAARGRVVLAHLGNGASLAALRDAKPVDTSMGYTPTSGVPMSTRSGDLDPGVLLYLARTERLDAARLNQLLNTESGLLGISETASDMRDLLEREGSDVRAAEAVALFCYQVKKWIGAYAAALGGIDTLVFSGGIGEHAAEVRSRICAGMGFLGIELDATRNSHNEAVISSSHAAV